MRPKSVKNLIFAVAVATALATFALESTSFAQGRGILANRKNCRQCCRCPKCENEVCQLKCEEATEEKTCFKVDYKTICIPKVRLPWQKCDPPGCGKARSVKFLVTHTYECPTCKYTWEVIKCDAPAFVDPATSNIVPNPTNYANPQHANTNLPNANGIPNPMPGAWQGQGTPAMMPWGQNVNPRQAPYTQGTIPPALNRPALLPQGAYPNQHMYPPQQYTRPPSYVVPATPAASGTLTDGYFGGPRK